MRMTDENKGREPREDDLLVEFERTTLPDDYREYYKTKRHNLLASIQQLPSLWGCFMLLDKIWFRELEDSSNVSGESQIFPLLLYINAHNKIRLALELGFSACTTEAISIMRDAIESAVHAHTMLLNPDLLKVWLEKDGDKVQRKAFKDAFEDAKKERLFGGLDELHGLWRTFSEMGSHTTMHSLMQRFAIERTATHLQLKLNYTGVVEEKDLAGSLFMMLLAAFNMEQLVFESFHSRLHLDSVLVTMRGKFETDLARCRKEMIVRYKIVPPTVTK